MRFRPKGRGFEPWSLVDPALVDPDYHKLAAALLNLANSDWTAELQVDSDHEFLRSFMRRHRVVTLLRTTDVTDPASHIEELLHINGLQLRIESVAAEVLQTFADLGIEARVLKGLASAELDYPERRFRHGGDVDLAIRKSDIDRATSHLTRHGYRPLHTQHETLLKGMTVTAPNGIEVDLHTRLFRRSRLSDLLFIDGEQLTDLPGVALPVNLRLLHAAGHFILAPPGKRRMSGLVDIARIRRHGAVDLEVVREYASSLGIEGLVGSALKLEAQLSGRTADVESVSHWKQPDWLDRSTRLVPERNLKLDYFARPRSVLREDRMRYFTSGLVPSPRQRQMFRSDIEAKIRRIRRHDRTPR